MLVVLNAYQDNAEQLKRLDTPLRFLMNVQKAGYLEPFVLFNRANQELIQDYASYRSADREKLRRYLDEFVVPKI
jgi:hypothetical protein